MKQFETLESGRLDGLHIETQKEMALVNPFFKTKITPENKLYAAPGIVKNEGLRADGIRSYVKKLAGEGKLYPNREASLNRNSAITETKSGLPARAMLRDENMLHVTDSHGRVIAAKIEDIKVKEKNIPRERLPSRKPAGWRQGDDSGHLIADHFNGHAKEQNLVAQDRTVNRKIYKEVEKYISDQIEGGHKVDYEVRVNYDDSTGRPSSFVPKITIDGKEVKLTKELRKIYNKPTITRKEKFVTTVKEKTYVAKEIGKEAHGVSMKSAELAAGVTLATSTVKYSKEYLQGEITAGEMAEGIAKETAAAGAGAYGVSFVTQAASAAMRRSSIELINKVGGSCAPAMAVSFAVSSYDAVTQFAKGEIDGKELAYDLGNNAVSLAGSTAGGALAATAIGAVGVAAGPAAIAVGVLGGTLGCAVSSVVYESAVELGAQGAEIVAEKAKSLAQETTAYFEDQLPDKVADVKSAFNDYFAEHKLGIRI